MGPSRGADVASPMCRNGWSSTLAAVVALAVAAAAPAADSPDDFFETNVRPVLVDVCGRCHGPEKQKGGLRLDSRAAAFAGGDHGPAVVPGKPGESRLVAAVRRRGELKMPPDAPLTERQVAALARWVELGAPWPAARSATASKALTVTSAHWAFQPVRDPPPPAVRKAGWVRTPVDRFVLAKLEAEGLTPSPPADRRALIRRVTFDLTGLPPTPDEVAAFVHDDAPDAYERLVDRLLASPHYGEHWGRHWLDVARYSDTKGYVYDREERFWVHAWAYRDWVVRALNRDLPYDRFVLLQLAADQAATDDPPSQAAMGFLTLGRRFLGVTHDIIDDRIDVVTRGLLGLTVACARCHDHKYDPIPTDDYYSLYGVFRSCSERLVPASRPGDDSPAAAAVRRGLADAQMKLRDALAAQRAEAAGRARARVADYLLAQLELHKYPEEGFDVVLAADDLIPAAVRRWRDYLSRATSRRDPVFAAWHAFARLPADEFAARAGAVCRKLAEAPAAAVNPLVARTFAAPPHDMADVARRYADLFAAVDKEPSADPAAEAVRRVLYGPDSPCEVPDEPIVDTEQFFPTKVVDALWKLQKDVDRHLINAPAAPPYATVLIDRPTPADARVLRRGNPATPGRQVPRQFLELLAGPDRQPFRRGSGRLELAQAIIDPANPLTARVLVNRVWLHHFGAGLVRTPSDFGARAEPPTHPELLDWLARRFVADGWSVKALHRRIVLSATYRQAPTGPADASVRDRASARDPENRWLWRGPAHRLSFEELHDSLYAVTGRLDPRVGGKPADMLARPFSPRRTVYGLIDRQYFPELLRSFDVANPDLHIPQRSDTTVPQQALFFLNHPLVLDAARSLARHPAVADTATAEQRVERMYRLAYQRLPTAAQVRRAVEFVHAAEADPTPAVRPSAWTYGYGTFDPAAGTLTNFRPLPYFTGTAWQGGPAWPDAALGWAQLTADGGHAGNDLAHAVVRRWTAPADGTVRVRSALAHDGAAGDGVRGSVVSSRHGRLASAVVHNGRADLNLAAVEVRSGDTLDFVVDVYRTLNNNQFTWAPVITEVGGSTWNAKAEFGGESVAPLTVWEQLAQALLMANEFCFVD